MQKMFLFGLYICTRHIDGQLVTHEELIRRNIKKKRNHSVFVGMKYDKKENDSYSS